MRSEGDSGADTDRRLIGAQGSMPWSTVVEVTFFIGEWAQVAFSTEHCAFTTQVEVFVRQN